MKTSVIKKHILEGLAPYVEEYGYKILKSQFEIVRKDREKSFQWVFINKTPLWDDEKCYTLKLWCNFKKILDVSEKITLKRGGHLIYNCASVDLPVFQKYIDGTGEIKDVTGRPEQADFTLTLLDGVVFDSAENFKQYRHLSPDTPVFIIDDENSYEPVVDYLRTLLPYAAKFFESVDTIEKLDKLYNRLPIRNTPLASVPEHASVGLISAKLTNNPNYEVLKTAYIQYLKENKYDTINTNVFNGVIDLIAYLDTRDFK